MLWLSFGKRHKKLQKQKSLRAVKRLFCSIDESIFDESAGIHDGHKISQYTKKLI